MRIAKSIVREREEFNTSSGLPNRIYYISAMIAPILTRSRSERNSDIPVTPYLVKVDLTGVPKLRHLVRGWQITGTGKKNELVRSDDAIFRDSFNDKDPDLRALNIKCVSLVLGKILTSEFGDMKSKYISRREHPGVVDLKSSGL